MLQSIRDRASGWIAYVIVFLISVPFALWGLHEYLGGGETLIAAEVNGQEIPLQEFNTQYQQQRQLLRARFGGNAPAAFLDSPSVKDGVIRNMVRRLVLSQETNDAGFGADNQVVLDQLSSIPAFQNEGRFDKERYEQVLYSQRRSPQEFEQQFRESLDLTSFENGLRATSFLTTAEKQAYLRLRDQTRELSYVLIPAHSYGEQVTISDEAIKAHYEENTAQFQALAKVKLEYIELAEAALEDQVSADEEQLRELYEDQIDQFTTVELRKARHIVVKLDEGAGEEAVKVAEEKAARLRQRLTDGEEFAALASEASEDELSAATEGDLGFIAPGDMDPAFENALFALSEGEISEPVRTGLGFEIIQFTEIKPKEQQSFEEVKDRVETEYKQRIAESQFVEQAELLVTLSFEQPDSLEPAADALGVEVQTTDWLTRDDTDGIVAAPEVKNAMFSDEVLQTGQNSDLLELQDGRVVVLRVAEHEPAKPKLLEEVSEDISVLLTLQRTGELAMEAGEEALGKLRGGDETMEDVAESLELELEAPGYVQRNATTAPAPILREIFSLEKAGEGAPVYTGVALPGGDYAVIAVTDVKDGGDGSDEQLVELRSQQDATYGARELEAAVAALEAAAEVRILHENL